LSSVQAFQLLFPRLRSSGFLPLDVFDHRLEKLDVSRHLLCLRVLRAKALLKDGQRLFSRSESSGNVTREEMSLSELMQRLAGLNVFRTKELRRRVLNAEKKLERQGVF
jgi:hypothetical protein